VLKNTAMNTCARTSEMMALVGATEKSCSTPPFRPRVQLSWNWVMELSPAAGAPLTTARQDMRIRLQC